MPNAAIAIKHERYDGQQHYSVRKGKKAVVLANVRTGTYGVFVKRPNQTETRLADHLASDWRNVVLASFKPRRTRNETAAQEAANMNRDRERALQALGL